MSLGIVIKGPEGIVLAADSRVTLSIANRNISATFDNATKVFSFNNKDSKVGVVTYGLAAIGLRAANSFIPEFEQKLPNESLDIETFSKKLSEFFMDQWNLEMPDPSEYKGPDMTFVVGGFDEDEPYGKVFLIEIPKKPEPVAQHVSQDFGITWGGQREYVDRLIQGFDPRLMDFLKSQTSLPPELDEFLLQMQMQIPLPAMALQDCVDLAIFFVRTTIDAQKLSFGVRGCGGSIDVATITRKEGLKFVQRKQIVGEEKNNYYGGIK
jgi:20S proteasome alpha/beta subunit